MARLRQRKIASFSRALSVLYAEDDPASLSARVLTCVRKVFDCEFASFSLMDLRQGRWHTAAFSPMLVPDWPGVETYQKHLRDDPAAVYIMRTRDPRALKISDFVSLREYRNLSVYTEVFGRVGCNRRLGFAIQHATPAAIAVTINRAGRDFSEEDRTLLDLLRPHLVQANAKAYTHRHLQAQRERERHDLGKVFGAGLGEVDETGKIHWITTKGQSLLADFFPAGGCRAHPGTLPEEVRQHLVPLLRQPREKTAELLLPPRFAWHFAGPDGRRLNVRLVASTTEGRWQLILEEAGPSLMNRSLSHVFRLTRRETEVTHWLTQGKTNGEMGTILNITEKTVGKHLEHIYTKLRVENRTAAARLALEFSVDPHR